MQRSRTPGQERGRRRPDQSGVAHLVLLMLVVVLGVLLASAYLGATGNPLPSSVPSPKIDTAAVTRAVAPSVANITATLAGVRGRVAGTGLVLSPSGAVLTNNHVIAGAESITVQVNGTGPNYRARVTGYDVADDIAVVQLAGASGLRVAPLGDPASAARRRQHRRDRQRRRSRRETGRRRGHDHRVRPSASPRPTVSATRARRSSA